VDEIVALRAAEIAADGAGVGLVAEGSAEHLSSGCDNLIGLPDHCHNRSGCDEIDKLGEEGFFLVNVVEPAGELFVDVYEFCRDDFSTLALEAGYDFASEVPLYSVRLNDD